MESNKQIEEQARATRAAYFREWRRKNPDKVRANNKRYWERRAQKLQASEGRVDDAKTDV